LRPPAANTVLKSACRALYRAWERIGLSLKRPAPLAFTMILVGVGSSGCSVFPHGGDGPFAMMTGKEVTGALAEPRPTESDLAFARDAASDVLTKGDKDSSQPWENAKTGAHGSVTPLAKPYARDDGRSCRDFLASYVNGKTESWLQGSACKMANDRWEIQTLSPWRRS
jgi:surface antigen